MGFLEFGMENRNSGSAMKRKAAEGALKIARAEADLCEKYLEKKQISVPDDPEGAERMMKRIEMICEWREINEGKK